MYISDSMTVDISSNKYGTTQAQLKFQARLDLDTMTGQLIYSQLT